MEHREWGSEEWRDTTQLHGRKEGDRASEPFLFSGDGRKWSIILTRRTAVSVINGVEEAFRRQSRRCKVPLAGLNSRSQLQFSSD